MVSESTPVEAPAPEQPPQRANITVPMLNTAKPWTRNMIIYWILMWGSLAFSFAWGVYTLDVWPLAMWCAISITGILAMNS